MRTFLLVMVVGCGGNQIEIQGQEVGTAPPRIATEHAHNDDSIDLPDDEDASEPNHPATQSAQERATTHVHTPIDICSGVLVGPRLVLTAHQCLGNAVKGATANTKDGYRVEVATSSLTWSARSVTHTVTPSCDWTDFDAAILVLDAETPGSKPLVFGSTPSPGGNIQALGFGRCRGETRAFGERTGQLVSREPDAISIDFGMCQGDVGGAIVDPGGELVGIVSHQDDPNGATRHTTTAFRADAPEARALLAAGRAIVSGTDPAKIGPIACK